MMCRNDTTTLLLPVRIRLRQDLSVALCRACSVRSSQHHYIGSNIIASEWCTSFTLNNCLYVYVCCCACVSDYARYCTTFRTVFETITHRCQGHAIPKSRYLSWIREKPLLWVVWFMYTLSSYNLWITWKSNETVNTFRIVFFTTVHNYEQLDHSFTYFVSGWLISRLWGFAFLFAALNMRIIQAHVCYVYMNMVPQTISLSLSTTQRLNYYIYCSACWLCVLFWFTQRTSALRPPAPLQLLLTRSNYHQIITPIHRNITNIENIKKNNNNNYKHQTATNCKKKTLNVCSCVSAQCDALLLCSVSLEYTCVVFGQKEWRSSVSLLCVHGGTEFVGASVCANVFTGDRGGGFFHRTRCLAIVCLRYHTRVARRGVTYSSGGVAPAPGPSHRLRHRLQQWWPPDCNRLNSRTVSWTVRNSGRTSTSTRRCWIRQANRLSVSSRRWKICWRLPSVSFFCLISNLSAVRVVCYLSCVRCDLITVQYVESKRCVRVFLLSIVEALSKIHHAMWACTNVCYNVWQEQFVEGGLVRCENKLWRLLCASVAVVR